MAIKLVSKEHHETICALFDEAEKSIKIISPFIGTHMAKLFIDAKKQNPNLDAKLITRFYRGDFIKGVSTIRALKDMHDSGIEIYALKGLHTKLYLFDADVALLGSANFTSGGFKFNHELSLHITDEKDINAQMTEHFDALVNDVINHSAENLLSMDIIAKELAYVLKEQEKKKDKTLTTIYNHKLGAELNSYKFDTDASTENTPSMNDDPIQIIISEAEKASIVASDYDGRAWIKFIGETDSRFKLSDTYYPQLEDGYPAGIICYPTSRKPSSVAEGDYVYVATISMDEKGNIVLPYIVGRGTTTGWKPGNVATSEMLKKHDWMERFKNFCVFTEFEYIDATIGECIPLMEVLQVLRADTYASTAGQNLDIENLRRRHSQKAHMILTPLAKSYIDEAFDRAVEKHGVKKLTDAKRNISRKVAGNSQITNNSTTKGYITAEMIEFAYGVAKKVYNGAIGISQGKSEIVTQTGMNENSAQDLIIQFRKMREGALYTRNLSSRGTKFYFENIHRDFGNDGLKNALQAARSHVEYYESLPNGARLRLIDELIDEFSLKIQEV